jgi:hypothetical protein
MALIVESKYTSLWSGGVPYAIKGNASGFEFVITSSKLSIPYSLKDGEIITGIILKVEDLDKKEYPELREQEIELILYTLLSNDYLFISKSDWENKFREYGLVIAFYISAKLKKATKKDGTVLNLYTKTDIKA